jgi:hypothetical protein
MSTVLEVELVVDFLLEVEAVVVVEVENREDIVLVGEVENEDEDILVVVVGVCAAVITGEGEGPSNGQKSPSGGATTQIKKSPSMMDTKSD